MPADASGSRLLWYRLQEVIEMVHDRMVRGLCACVLAVILAGGLSGCSRQEPALDPEKEPVPGAAGQEISELRFSVEKYRERMLADRVELSEYRSSYREEADRVADTDYANVHFEGCEFLDLPDAVELEMMAGLDHGITVQESWDTVAAWLERIGKQDAVDMKQDLRVVSPQFETDDSKEYPYNYAGFYEHMDEMESGSGALVDGSRCHMQIAGDGIYSMSDGKITEYLGLETRSGRDATGDNIGDILESGTLEEMADISYKLPGGKLTVGEGAGLVKDYFMAGTPFPCEDGLSVDIPEASVCRLGDAHVYDYMVRRVRNGVPFVYMDHGSYRFDGGYLIVGDIKHAYVVDDTGVTAFAGYNEAERLVPLVTDRKIIGVSQMAEILGEKLAPHVNIHATSVGLAYLPVVFGEGNDEYIIFPCWQLTGESRTKGRHIGVFVDAFTGEIYYYT